MTRGRRALERALAAVAAACLAVTLLAAGFAACALPATTRMLSEYTSDFAAAPYSHDALVALACETRAFTVEDYGRSEVGTEGARERLAALEEEAELKAGGAFDARDERYALDDDAFSHLEDCNRLIAAAVPVLAGLAAACAAAFGALAACARRDAHARRLAANALLAGPAALLAALAGAGAWAAVDFDAFFAAFHGAFFPQGNWTFPADSLLICMYPLDFWVGMAIVWASAAATAAIICLIVGTALRRKAIHD